VRACPTCKTSKSVRVISYGFPSEKLDEDIYTQGGCSITKDTQMPSYRCIECGWEGMSNRFVHDVDLEGPLIIHSVEE